MKLKNRKKYVVNQNKKRKRGNYRENGNASVALKIDENSNGDDEISDKNENDSGSGSEDSDIDQLEMKNDDVSSENEKNSDIDNSDVAEESDLESEESEVDGAETEGDEDMDESKLKESLKNLEKTDPEFYQYLQENDGELLKFDDNDTDTDVDKEEEEEEEEDDKHHPPESLEVASDEDDTEEGIVTNKEGTKVTLALVDEWEHRMSSNKKYLKNIPTVTKAFHAALLNILGEKEDKRNVKLIVEGSAVFNAVVRLCVTCLYPCIQRALNLPESSVSCKHVQASKLWLRMKVTIRNYVSDLVKLIENVTSPDVLTVLLKHLHQMLPLASCLPTICRYITKRLMMVWSRNADDTTRVVAFLCILRLTTLMPSLHTTVVKLMYASYVANSKFVSPNSLPGINFMRRSLTEMFSLDESVSYNYAFLYIRQLAIHLRSAVTLKKKENMQSIYSWRYICSLRLWVDVLCATKDKSQMQSLLYPLIQVIVGCIKLIPTAQYLPLRFHCIEMLTKLSKEIGVYIPVLPLLLEALTLANVNSQHKKLSMKPMDFTCVLRLTGSQLKENSFKDAAVEYFYQHLLEYTASESHRISFPDLIVPCVMQMKQFLKSCKNSNYTRKLKPLLEKIEENSKAINGARSKCGIKLNDQSAIDSWESNIKLSGTPLSSYHASWIKIHERQQARKITDTIKVSDFALPVIKKVSKNKVKKEVPRKPDGTVELFPSDDDDDGDENVIDFKTGVEENENAEKEIVKSVKRKKKQKKKADAKKVSVKRKSEDIENGENEPADIVEDFRMSDFMT